MHDRVVAPLCRGRLRVNTGRGGLVTPVSDTKLTWLARHARARAHGTGPPPLESPRQADSVHLREHSPVVGERTAQGREPTTTSQYEPACHRAQHWHYVSEDLVPPPAAGRPLAEGEPDRQTLRVLGETGPPARSTSRGCSSRLVAKIIRTAKAS